MTTDAPAPPAALTAEEIADLRTYGVAWCTEADFDRLCAGLLAERARAEAADRVALAAGDDVITERRRTEAAERRMLELEAALTRIAAIEPASNCDAGSMARSRMRDIARAALAGRTA